MITRPTTTTGSTRLSMSTSASSSSSAHAGTSELNKDMNTLPSLETTKMINLHTIPVEELEVILESWGQPKYRAQQIWNWVRVQGVTSIDEMQNIPKALKVLLKDHATMGSLLLDCELVSKDGTIKRAYRLSDGQLIESVLMPYEDGRYTACISSQAGCAQGCVFCATGQMGFSRQLTPEEIFEQVSRFASELAAKEKHQRKEESTKKKNGNQKVTTSSSSSGRSTRLSNIVFMGMGEPLANYRNVKSAVQRIHDELGIGHRRITISTVGIVPNIVKLANDLPQVRLAVSLHCATDTERSALLPANKRNGGLQELMSTLQSYIQSTGKRITLEWALIEGKNDTPETAHQLGKLIHQWLRKDMVHVNVIPLNPTGGYGGSPSGRQRVNTFCKILEDTYQVACTPRVRRGIDINAGCGQLKSEIEKRQKAAAAAAAVDDTDDNDNDTDDDDASTTLSWQDKGDEEQDPTSLPLDVTNTNVPSLPVSLLEISMDSDEDWQDDEFTTKEDMDEATRIINMVRGTVMTTDNPSKQ